MTRFADQRRSGPSDALRPNEILPMVEIHLVPNSHPFQVNPGISFLRTLERLSFVSGRPFPNCPLMRSRPAVSSRTGNGFNITANDFNHIPVGHGVVMLLGINCSGVWAARPHQSGSPKAVHAG